MVLALSLGLGLTEAVTAVLAAAGIGVSLCLLGLVAYAWVRHVATLIDDDPQANR